MICCLDGSPAFYRCNRMLHHSSIVKLEPFE